MNTRKLALWAIVFAIAAFSVNVLALPFGASVTEEKTERAPADIAGNDSALAGNITELTIFAYSTTQSWQGYMGNISGVVQLADASDNVLYNWSLASPEGEIYASVNGSITWANIQCFNFSATGTMADDSAQRGATSLYGMNLTTLEATYGVAWDDVDGVNETFSLAGTHESGGGFTHTLFYTNSLQFDAGECLSTHLFGNGGSVADASFEEVLLYDPEARAVVFTTLIDEDVLGFDGRTHDFEMLVLEDGHGTNIATTTYFFYVELE